MTENSPAKQPSKTAQLKAERKARREAREAKKIRDAQRLEAARLAITEVTKVMPADYPDWGITRTRGYMQLREIVLAKVENTTIKPDALEKYLAELRNVSNWTLDYCQHLSMLHSRAAEIGEPA